jgi:segregation and condensation protein B
VKGNLPQEKEKEREPVQKSGFLRSTPEAERSGAEKPGFSVPSQNGVLTLGAFVESLLFVADGPVPVARIAEALEVTPREVEAALTTLGEAYATAHRGLSLQRFRDKVQLTTAPAAASAVERFLGLAATAPLSRAALETLAIIAYQQPVTRPQIESVRGVNSDSVLKTLLSKGLIEEVGRTEGPGRPVLYATTPEFLQYFGLSALTDLPPLSLDQPPTLPEPESNGADKILKE